MWGRKLALRMQSILGRKGGWEGFLRFRQLDLLLVGRGSLHGAGTTEGTSQTWHYPLSIDTLTISPFPSSTTTEIRAFLRHPPCSWLKLLINRCNNNCQHSSTTACVLLLFRLSQQNRLWFLEGREIHPAQNSRRTPNGHLSFHIVRKQEYEPTTLAYQISSFSLLLLWCSC